MVHRVVNMASRRKAGRLPRAERASRARLVCRALLIGLVCCGVGPEAAHGQRSQASSSQRPAEVVGGQQRGAQRDSRGATGNKAEGSSQPSSSAERKAEDARSGRPSVDAEDVIAFVRRHQPRLAKLIDYLKDRNRRQYERAMREIRRVKTRLENLEQRDPELHAVELELWKVRSELQLVAAEAAADQAAKRPKFDAALERLVQRETALEIDRLEVLRARAAKQLQELENQVQARRASRNEDAQRRLMQWKSKIEREANQIRGEKESPSNDQAKGKQGDE